VSVHSDGASARRPYEPGAEAAGISRHRNPPMSPASNAVNTMPGDPFDFDLPADTALRRAASIAARPLLSWALRLNTLRELYAQANSDWSAFPTSALRVLCARAECCADEVAHVPANGPLIVAANHPHGALDGLLLLDLIGRARKDVRLLANHLLACIPELRDFCFFVDPFERPGAAERSLAGLRAAHLWLRRGGALVIFPAGEVAHVRRADGSIADSSWRSTVGRIALTTGARVVPARVEGANSPLFYAAGRIHPLLRTVLLSRELLRSRGRSVTVRVGRALSTDELGRHGRTADRVTAAIRQAVEHLESADVRGAVCTQPREVPVAPAADFATLDEEIRRLPETTRLVDGGALQVYCAEAGQIPNVLAEIGRLRELAYRSVGEGTGTRTDIDRFDTHYQHLFLWNQLRREVVGAYRIGRSDLIVASAGAEGLYTRTLFRYDERLLRRLPPALELGRSFVRVEYQRNHTPLLLLWKGICSFIARHPQYRVLFGAVSISARYSDRTREMLMAFLEQNHLDRVLSELVSPKNAPRSAPPKDVPVGTVPTSVEEVDTLVSKLETDGQGIPVLLRQYLKLNARLLGFSVDSAFGDALDALMTVDLARADPRILRRYFGPADARAFLEYHAAQSAAHAA
jgi:putative hemolysin